MSEVAKASAKVAVPAEWVLSAPMRLAVWTLLSICSALSIAFFLKAFSTVQDGQWWSCLFYFFAGFGFGMFFPLWVLSGGKLRGHLPMGRVNFSVDRDIVDIGENIGLQIAQLLGWICLAVAGLLMGVGVPAGHMRYPIAADSSDDIQRFIFPAAATVLSAVAIAVLLRMLTHRTVGRLLISPRGFRYWSLTGAEVSVKWNAVRRISPAVSTFGNRRTYGSVDVSLHNGNTVSVAATYLSFGAPAVYWLMKAYQSGHVTSADKVLDDLYAGRIG